MAVLDANGLTRLGDGPVATVYSGHRDGVPVAYKVFPKRFDKRTMAAFTKEQATLAGLRRVGSILPVDGVDELASGEPALRMELCPRSLAAVVERNGRLAAAEVVALGKAAALALAAAHEAGIVHGGMSPHNVLFRASGEPVLADFGVTIRQALARDPLHAIEFLPPETLRTGALDKATDLYGLGALLHYALAGRCPHPGRLGEQPGERVLRILGDPVPAINADGVPVALATQVARLLATDPARRPADAAQVAAQLGALAPERSAVPPEDFDDFAGAPVPPPVALAHRPAPYDEFDDFAQPGYPAPAPRPAVPSPVTVPPVAVRRVVPDPVPPRPVAPDQGAPGPAAVAGPAVGDPAMVEPAADGTPSVPVPGLPAVPVVPAVSPVPPPPAVPDVPPALAWEPAPAVPPGSGGPPSPVSGGSHFAGQPFGDDDFVGSTPYLPAERAADSPAARRRVLVSAAVGGGVLLGVLAIVLALLLGNEPEVRNTRAQAPDDDGVAIGDVQIELARPVDRTDHVELTWRSTRELDFAVVVAADGERPQFFLAERNHNSMTVEVEPGRKYCFMIQATDAERVYESQPMPLRGATCRK